MRSRALKHPPGANASAGFTLVELAVVIGVIGLLAMTMTSGFESISQAKQRNGAKANAQQAREALRTFALRNKRLPCPDPSAQGDTAREPSGTCGSDVGWLPYESLGLDTPVRGQRLRYAVYRGTAGADLVAPARGGTDSPDLEGSNGLIAALASAARATPSKSQPYYVNGQGDLLPACDPAGAGTALVNPAFAVIAPASNIGASADAMAGFEAPNRTFSAASRCFGAPDNTANANYDDVVVVEGLTSMLGWAMSTTR